MTETIKIDPVCRVEGYGRIEVSLNQGEIEKLEVQLAEGSRFFEALVRGHSYEEVHHISCRICAICSSVHQLAALAAVEDALKVTVSPQVKLLRELLIHGGNIESHALHIFCLAAPDVLGYSSAVSLADDHLEVVKLGLWLKKLGNEIQELIAGRAIHSSNTAVGGFGKMPTRAQLQTLKGRLEKGLAAGEAAIEFLMTLEFPRYASSPSVFACLNPPEGQFGFQGPTIITSTGAEFDIHDYQKICQERAVRYSHAKKSYFEEQPFMVGSLARIALLGERLEGLALKARQQLNLAPPYDNTVVNSLAQAVEMIFSLERSLAIVKQLLPNLNEKEALPSVTPQAGSGTGAIEAPRGTLYHHYEFDAAGIVTAADIITPTAQNAANLEKDIRAVVQNNPNLSKEDLSFAFEVMARAYDPCISCSVHVLSR